MTITVTGPTGHLPHRSQAPHFTGLAVHRPRCSQSTQVPQFTGPTLKLNDIEYQTGTVYVCHLQIRNTLEIQFNSLQADYDSLHGKFEEETETSGSLRNQLTKLQGEYQTLKVNNHIRSFDKK